MKNSMKRFIIFALTVIMVGSMCNVANASSELKMSGKNQTTIGDDGVVGYFGNGEKKSVKFSLTVPSGTTTFYLQDIAAYTVTLINSAGKKVKTIKPEKSKEKRWSESTGQEEYIYTINTGIKLSKGTYKVSIKAKTNLDGIMKIVTYNNKGGKIKFITDENSGYTTIGVTKNKTYKFKITVPKDGQYAINSLITPYGTENNAYIYPETKITNAKGKKIAALKRGGSGTKEIALKKGTYTIEVKVKNPGLLDVSLQQY
ncbi:MAG: hypothetical protein ACERKN_02440 [Velocimicrobium sp.]